MPTETTIKTPPNFSFKRTIISHGWCQLLPFTIDEKKWQLTRVIDLHPRPPVTVSLSLVRRSLRIKPSRQLNQNESARVLKDVGHVLRLDDNLDDFYQITNANPEFSWISHQGAGRMLRSPTVFEDLVKMICTTNCSWSLTEKMVTGIVENLGREGTMDGARSPPPRPWHSCL